MANGVENTTEDLEEKDPIIVEENNDSEENQDSNINGVKTTPISEEPPVLTDNTEQTDVELSEKMTWDSKKSAFVKENGDYLARDRWGKMVWYNIDGKELNPTPNPEWMYDHPDDEDEIERDFANIHEVEKYYNNNLQYKKS